jgi:Tocopherol cyclase
MKRFLPCTFSTGKRRSFLTAQRYGMYQHKNCNASKGMHTLFLLVLCWHGYCLALVSRQANCRKRGLGCRAAERDAIGSEGAAEYGIVEPTGPAFPQQTPHSGRHFGPSHPAYQRTTLFQRWKRRRRFTEGWYYRLTLPEEHVSFAFIFSIEDPGHRPPSNLRLACVQVIGPNDEYIVQGDRDDSLFWAWKHQQGFGCSFEYKSGVDCATMKQRTALTASEWNEKVASGFQVLPNSLRGRVRGRDGTKHGILDEPFDLRSCEFDVSIKPVCGWGGTASTQQKSTAGWLSSFPVFEPHWQITLADARASGSVTWNNQTFTFIDAPFYAEKNWGAALPRKWYGTFGWINSLRG